jgi:hypothetical protein
MLSKGASTAAHLGFASLRLTAVTIRLGHESDLAQLERLAERDTRPLPSGELLVAERDGAIHAALSLDTDDVVADPFKPTAELVELLRAHARREAPPRRTAGRRRLAPRLVGST